MEQNNSKPKQWAWASMQKTSENSKILGLGFASSLPLQHHVAVAIECLDTAE